MPAANSLNQQVSSRQHQSGNLFPREPQAGVCLHITSLPGPYGMGELGQAARQFVDLLAAMSVSVWQILPTGPTAFGDSPYQPLSSFAGNEMLIDTQTLLDAQLLTWQEVAPLTRLPVERVDFGRLIPLKRTLLFRAADRFLQTASAEDQVAYEAFQQQHSAWLNDYALYRTIKSMHQEISWVEWAPQYRDRHSSAVSQLEAGYQREIERFKVLQYLYFQQWEDLHIYAKAKDVLLFGDIPIYLALDSADVWTDRTLVKLDSDNNPLLVAGVPPDDFSADGQLWGNPIYDWEHHRQTGYSWWIDRIRHTMSAVDLVRIDHFRGLESYWAIPFDAPTAETGKWLAGPAYSLFDAIYGAIDNTSLVAEDLGFMTPEVEALRAHYQIPGMIVLQEKLQYEDFGLGDIQPNSVCYAGTHDTDTSLGWFDGSPGDIRTPEQIASTRQRVLALTGGSRDSLSMDMIIMALSSPANLVILMMQDIVGLGSVARFNLPGTSANNWQWRVTSEQLNADNIDRVAGLIQSSKRSAKRS